jgi:hypothetical protein
MPIDERQERLKALDVAVGQIEKQFGKGRLCDSAKTTSWPRWK